MVDGRRPLGPFTMAVRVFRSLEAKGILPVTNDPEAEVAAIAEAFEVDSPPTHLNHRDLELADRARARAAVDDMRTRDIQNSRPRCASKYPSRR